MLDGKTCKHRTEQKIKMQRSCEIGSAREKRKAHLVTQMGRLFASALIWASFSTGPDGVCP
jgi:hypothetical protein